MKNIKKYKWAILGLIVVLITFSIIKTREDNHKAVSFVANITNELHLTGEDGRPMLTGAECIHITKNLQNFASTSSQISFNDIKTIMQILNYSGGMNGVSTGYQYEETLIGVLSDIEVLMEELGTEDYEYLINEMLSYSKIEIPLSDAKDAMIKLNNSAKHAGISYQEAKTNIRY